MLVVLEEIFKLIVLQCKHCPEHYCPSRFLPLFRLDKKALGSYYAERLFLCELNGVTPGLLQVALSELLGFQAPNFQTSNLQSSEIESLEFGS